MDQEMAHRTENAITIVSWKRAHELRQGGRRIFVTLLH